MTTLSIVVPTFNEADNLPTLLERISNALGNCDHEIIVIDDSTDDTPEIARSLNQQYPGMTFTHREENVNGLAGAVILGCSQANGKYIVVLDADLQHPPESIPTLLSNAQETEADVVIASRYMPGGSYEGLNGPIRKLISIGLKELTRLLFFPRLKEVDDPLSGFFLFRRSLIENIVLKPIGFKVSLEVLTRTPHQKVTKVPYQFRVRNAGKSKASLTQGLTFFRHLFTLIQEVPWLLQPNRPLPTDLPVEFNEEACGDPLVLSRRQ